MAPVGIIKLAVARRHRSAIKKQPRERLFFLTAKQSLLPDLDSNQDKLNQNQLYCHYTIGQFPIGDAKVGSEAIPANFLLGFLG